MWRTANAGNLECSGTSTQIFAASTRVDGCAPITPSWSIHEVKKNYERVPVGVENA
jgi:hypothetical protein